MGRQVDFARLSGQWSPRKYPACCISSINRVTTEEMLKYNSFIDLINQLQCCTLQSTRWIVMCNKGHRPLIARNKIGKTPI